MKIYLVTAADMDDNSDDVFYRTRGCDASDKEACNLLYADVEEDAWDGCNILVEVIELESVK